MRLLLVFVPESKIPDLPSLVVLEHKRLDIVANLLNANDLVTFVQVEEAKLLLLDFDLNKLTLL